jgi:hypothetical protein
MWETGNAYNILVGKENLEGWKDKIEVNIMGIDFEDGKWLKTV